MPTPTLDNNALILVSMVGNLGGQRILGTFYYRVSTPPAAPTAFDVALNALVSKINSAGNLADKYLACLGGSYTLEYVQAQQIAPTRLRYVTGGVPQSGTFPDFDNTTANIAASIERFSAAPGNQGYGRIQMPLPDGQCIDGNLVDVNGYVTALDTLGLQMLQPITTVGTVFTVTPCMQAVGATGVDTYDLIGKRTQPTVRTMHRRTVGLGI